MNKKTNISFGIIAMLLIVFSIYTVNYPNEVYAQTFQAISGFAYNIKGISYQSTTDSFWVITEGSGKTFLYQVSRTSKAIIGSFNQTKNFDDLSLGGAQDIWCGKTDCYITTGAGAGSGGVVRIPTQDVPPNIFKGTNITGSVFGPVVAPFYHLTGRDEVAGGFGTVTLWVDGCSEAVATCDGQLRTIDGISMQIVSTANPYSSSNNGAVHVHDMQWSGIAGVDDNDLATVTGDTSGISANAELRIFDLTQSPIVQHCVVDTPSTNQPYGVATNYVSAGSADNKVYVSADAGNLYVYNDDCTLLQSFNSTLTGLSSDIRYIDYSAGKIFMQESGANAKISQMLVNSTGHVLTGNNVYFPLPTVAQDVFESDGYTLSHSIGELILLAGNGQIWYSYTGSDKRVGILTLTGGATGTSQVCIDTDLNGTLDLCFTDTNNDGVPDNGQLGALGAYRSNSNLTSFATSMFCAFGINTNACINHDIKTNGAGLSLLAFLILVSYAFLVSIHHTTLHRQGETVQVMKTLNINPMLLLVMLIIDVGIAFYLGWIPDLVFYTIIVAMIGLASFGLYRKFF